MALEARVERESKRVVHNNAKKTEDRKRVDGVAKVTLKLHWTRNSVRRGHKKYVYIRPRLDIPIDLLEKLGVKPLEGVEFDVEIVERDDGKVLVLKPRIVETHV
ncbi:hypothetical protein Pyrfu_0365 [Pyrolobus fumarii 1A]|uniref:Uncharacterized protein n=1 Tax=Pyrolobus fumarii (strain DSM 11204 / 1A) TaxID=694429 RepID=G0EFR6_PYRF1|nr:hypothetical protein [Pyrolobus fumarii]AEM38237.1 hypothetical protein Pyrfu_0365 [Pyrolobus fumarii 1A]